MNGSTSLWKKSSQSRHFSWQLSNNIHVAFNRHGIILSCEFHGSATHIHTRESSHLQLPISPVKMVSTHRVLSGAVRFLHLSRPFLPFAFNFKGLMLVGDCSHRNLTSWQFYRPNISSLKIATFTVLGQKVCITLNFSLHGHSKATQHDRTFPQAFIRAKVQCRCEVGGARLTWHEQRMTHYINGKVRSV